MFHIVGLMLFSTLFALAAAGLVDAFAPIRRRLLQTGVLPSGRSFGFTDSAGNLAASMSGLMAAVARQASAASAASAGSAASETRI